MGESVILPIVLQIDETIVLQRAELEEKGRLPHFWAFALLTVLMGKHGFAEKIQIKWDRLTDEIGAYCVIRRRVNLIVIRR